MFGVNPAYLVPDFYFKVTKVTLTGPWDVIAVPNPERVYLEIAQNQAKVNSVVAIIPTIDANDVNYKIIDLTQPFIMYWEQSGPLCSLGWNAISVPAGNALTITEVCYRPRVIGSNSQWISPARNSGE